ncbi:MAG: hypothetical protein WCP11_00865 [Candidatus Saccharibacteria bacterium]
MIEINLVPDVKQEFIRAQQIRAKVITISIIVGVISIAAVVMLAVYIFTVQSVRGGMVDSAIGKYSKDLNNVEDLSKTLTIQNQLTKIQSLNDNKKISSRIFDVLKSIVPAPPNNIQISNLSVDTVTGTVSLDGQAANSYAAVEVFKKTIAGVKIEYTDGSSQKQEILLASNVNTSSTSYGEDSSGSKVLRFTLTFNYVTELFAPSSKDITIIISNNGNVTDSYLGVPQSVFADKAADLEGSR